MAQTDPDRRPDDAAAAPGVSHAPGASLGTATTPRSTGSPTPLKRTQGSHHDRPTDLVGRSRSSPVDLAKCSLVPYMIGPPIPPAATEALHEARPSTSPGAAGPLHRADPPGLPGAVGLRTIRTRLDRPSLPGLHTEAGTPITLGTAGAPHVIKLPAPSGVAEAFHEAYPQTSPDVAGGRHEAGATTSPDAARLRK
jgi:hypothetical protein